MPDKKNCFIIMPITTPDEWLSKYRNDEIHFHHVLDHLFLPAIELAGFNPIKPIAEGADNIPAEIIKNLDEADLVLCDLSIFNPNVFFELGIRTALDKPICLVKDEHSTRIPFDVSIINCLTYKSTLDHWDMNQEIQSISKHITSSLIKSKNRNPLWKYFGISTAAKSLEGGSREDKMDVILQKLESFEDVRSSRESNNSFSIVVEEDIKNLAYNFLNKIIPDSDWYITVNLAQKDIVVYFEKLPSVKFINQLKMKVEHLFAERGFFNYKINFMKMPF